MKRLLAYLFIVLGLVLTFSVSANAAKGFNLKYHSLHPEKIFVSKCRGTGKDGWCPINTKTHKNIYKYVKKNLKKDKKGVCRWVQKGTKLSGVYVAKGKTVCDKIYIDKNTLQIALKGTDLEKLLYVHSSEYWKDKRKELENKLAKAEPSQQEMICLDSPRGWIFFYQRYKTGDWNSSADVAFRCTTTIFPQDTRYNEFFLILTSDTIINKEFPVYNISKKKEVTEEELNKFVKKEPSQTQPDGDLEEEKRKIAEERKKIEEEKKKIAEAKKKQEEEDKKRKEANAKLYVIGSGTGFFVSSDGHVVSNDHVVGICRKVATKIEGKIINFNVINRDEVNDLGLIKGDYKSKNFLSIKSGGAEFGEDIVAFGYPLSDALSTSVKLTRGIVSSLSGPGNNYSEIQIDAAIQPGNSGGPVLNMEGQVVGVASSGLNKLYMLESTEYIPENVNFAVAATTLSNFLKANGVTISNASMDISNTKELAKIGRPATLQLFCMNTKAVYEELKKTKKHSDVLLEKVMELR